MWTLRLRGPKGKAATLQVDPQATVETFCDLVVAPLAIKGKTPHLTFRSGFPPRVVAYAPTDLVETTFSNNDTIVVDTTAASAEPRQAVAAPRGAAATGHASTAKAKAKEPARGVHSLHAAKPKAKPAVQKRKERGDGMRLGESMEEPSVVVDPAPSSPARKYRRTQAVHLTSKEDIGVKLVEAVSGASKDRAGKFFRAATKSAVEHQYEMTLANARLQAALSKKFKIQEVRTSQRAGSAASETAAPAAEMCVKFKESVRKWKEETVTLLQPLELQATLKYILISGGETGREMLKPFNMAQVSPRIARLYDGDVAAGLAALVPDEDWSYLDARTRQMSKKAVEAKSNEETYKQWKRQGTAKPAAAAVDAVTPAAKGTRRSAKQQPEVIEIDSDGDDDEEEKAATPSTAQKTEEQQLQSAIGYAEQAEKRSRREAMARAAAARVDARARAEEVSTAIRGPAVHEVEARVAAVVDGDEDVEPTTTVYCDKCNKARILSLPEATTVGVGQDSEEEETKWTCAKLTPIGRDGTCDAVDDELEQIAGEKLARLLQQQASIHTRQQLANASLLTALRGLTHPLDANYAETKAKLEEIIDEARLDEVNDAIAEIVGGDDELVGLLELQKLGTPADLVATPPDLITAAVASRETGVDMETVLQWQQRARETVARSPWMGEWRTI